MYLFSGRNQRAAPGRVAAGASACGSRRWLWATAGSRLVTGVWRLSLQPGERALPLALGIPELGTQAPGPVTVTGCHRSAHLGPQPLQPTL